MISDLGILPVALKQRRSSSMKQTRRKSSQGLRPMLWNPARVQRNRRDFRSMDLSISSEVGSVAGLSQMCTTVTEGPEKKATHGERSGRKEELLAFVRKQQKANPTAKCIYVPCRMRMNGASLLKYWMLNHPQSLSSLPSLKPIRPSSSATYFNIY